MAWPLNQLAADLADSDVTEVVVQISGSASRDEPDNQYNNGNDQQDVNKSADCVTGYQSQHPQNEQYHCYSP